MDGNTEIIRRLFEMRDAEYAKLQSKLVPGTDDNAVIGVRIPVLRKFAKELTDAEKERFIARLPHKYYDENILHGVIVSGIKDASLCLERLEDFLPYVDNWAVCDTIRPRCFAKKPEALTGRIPAWMASDRPYTVRFAMGMLMSYFLDGNFLPEYPEAVARTMETSPCREEYYVRMMAAWYFATALAKQYDASLPYIEQRRLDAWTHNKTIQKAIESYRVTDEHKAYLRTLRV